MRKKNVEQLHIRSESKKTNSFKEISGNSHHSCLKHKSVCLREWETLVLEFLNVNYIAETVVHVIEKSCQIICSTLDQGKDVTIEK